MAKHKISVFIIVFNEEKNIERCLKSVLWADEIVIVDAYSTDRTLEICGKYTDAVYQHKFTNFSEMKNYAMSKTSFEWVFSVDADEAVTDKLQKKIEDILEGETQNAGYFIKRKSCIFGRWFNFCGTQDDFQMRLFRKETAKYIQPIHEKVLIDGKTGYIKEPLLHYTYCDISEHLERMNKYTSMEAEFMKNRNKIPLLRDILLRPIARFVKLYIFKQGFRDGREGFSFSMLSGIYDFVKYCKLWEILRYENQMKKERNE